MFWHVLLRVCVTAVTEQYMGDICRLLCHLYPPSLVTRLTYLLFTSQCVHS